MSSPDRTPLEDPALARESAEREHLRAELARIDLLLRREVLLWRRAGQDPSDAFRGLYIAEEEVDALLGRPFATDWGGTTSLHASEGEEFLAELARLDQVATERAQAVQAYGAPPRLHHLKDIFGLDRFELDSLLICLAPALDLRYERIYGYLQDDVTRKRPTVNLILNLLAPDGPDRLPALLRFSHPAPLLANGLIRQVQEPSHPDSSTLGQTFSVDEAIVAWILGHYHPRGALQGLASLIPPEIYEADLILAGESLERVQINTPEFPVLAMSGTDRASQDAAARLVAGRLNRPLLQVDCAAESLSEGDELESAIRLALRDGRLAGALVFLRHFDQGLQAGSPRTDLAGMLAAHPDLLLVSTEQGWLASGPLRERRIIPLKFTIPDYAQRLILWHKFAPHSPDDVSGSALEELAGQFYLTAGQIMDAAATARDLASLHGRSARREDLFAAARAHSNPRLASLARQIQPRFGWPDIVLPQDQLALLREIIATVRGRPLVLDGWGLGKKLASSRGVTVLFAGPPGTGKTMAAEIIAGELGLDLFKIDLSTIVSKYIGETEKNLERIFAEAGASNAILFFDEADALFGKRSEVRDSHDRYANIEISYLLQRMEAYDGVTILATNLRANLDEAFTRRLQFSVDFPFPEAADRRRIWAALLPPTLPRDPGLDLDALADRFKLAGGNIRNILVSAAYLAAADGGKVTMDHLLHGARRELQKMGRLVNEQDLRAPEKVMDEG